MDEEPSFPDRPLDCSECKKPISVIYTEIVGRSVIRTSMCADCPEFEKKLHGGALVQEPGVPAAGHEMGLCCGTCRLTLDAVRKGENFGCKECYEVFGDILFQEMSKKKERAMPAGERKKAVLLHVGRAPGETTEIDPSVRLMALNESLEESLKHEDYEQAALLRDQIKELTENQDEKEKK